MLIGNANIIGSGFFLSDEVTPQLGPGSFGHAGAGGSLGFANPRTGVAFGYVMNKMNANIDGDPRVQALTSAVQSCL